jgi:hypothetical protein
MFNQINLKKYIMLKYTTFFEV